MARASTTSGRWPLCNPTTTGRFTSLDPLLELTDPQQINGYSYAAGNPVTGADPDGLQNEDCATGRIACSGGSPSGGGKAPTCALTGTCPAVLRAQQQSDTKPSSRAPPTKVEIYPTVIIPVDWKNRLKFVAAFYKLIDEDCGDEGFDFDCLDPRTAGPNKWSMAFQRLNTDVYDACADIKGCPKEVNGSSLASLSEPMRRRWVAPATSPARATCSAGAGEKDIEMPPALMAREPGSILVQRTELITGMINSVRMVGCLGTAPIIEMGISHIFRFTLSRIRSMVAP